MTKASKALILLSLGILFVFVSCKSKVPSTKEINQKWQLIAYGKFKKEDLIRWQAVMDLQASKEKDRENQYGARMGCNNMFFTAIFKNGSAEFSAVGSTMMYCEGRMELEEAFGKDLPKMKSYQIKGDKLILFSKELQMVFQRKR